MMLRSNVEKKETGTAYLFTYPPHLDAHGNPTGIGHSAVSVIGPNDEYFHQSVFPAGKAYANLTNLTKLPVPACNIRDPKKDVHAEESCPMIVRYEGIDWNAAKAHHQKHTDKLKKQESQFLLSYNNRLNPLRLFKQGMHFFLNTDVKADSFAADGFSVRTPKSLKFTNCALSAQNLLQKATGKSFIHSADRFFSKMPLALHQDLQNAGAKTIAPSEFHTLPKHLQPALELARQYPTYEPLNTEEAAIKRVESSM